MLKAPPGARPSCGQHAAQLHVNVSTRCPTAGHMLACILGHIIQSSARLRWMPLALAPAAGFLHVQDPALCPAFQPALPGRQCIPCTCAAWSNTGAAIDSWLTTL